ncbi:MAG: hypothetical protein JXA92_08385 [candidate division Zixibacteria bacterium]|nr:hypothetical protein [candidate division Zixibacteria bacterium]
MKRQILLTGVLTVLMVTSVLFVRNIHSQDSILQQIRKYQGWRAAWRLELSVWPDSASVPDSVFVTLGNRSKDTLRGSNLVWHLYMVDAYAIDRDIRGKEFELSPGEFLSYRFAFRSLLFIGYNGQPVDTALFFERLRTEPWRMKCFLTDFWSPKPFNESSHLVGSNLLEFNSENKAIENTD